jgi:hypothetical protein
MHTEPNYYSVSGVVESSDTIGPQTTLGRLQVAGHTCGLVAVETS